MREIYLFFKTLLIIGGLNWGLIGFFDYDLVAVLFGDMTVTTRAIYALVGISALFVIFYAIPRHDLSDRRSLPI